MIQMLRLLGVVVVLVAGVLLRPWWAANQPLLPLLVETLLPLGAFLAVVVVGQFLLLFRGKSGETGFTGSLLLVAIAWCAMGLSSPYDGWARVLPLLFALGMARLGGARGFLFPAWILFALVESAVSTSFLERIESIVATAFPSMPLSIWPAPLPMETLTVELAASLMITFALLFFFTPSTLVFVEASADGKKEKRRVVKDRSIEADSDLEAKPRKHRNKKSELMGDIAGYETSSAIVVGKEQSELDEVIGGMLFFLSKNFRSFSSLGFLSSDGGQSFRLAAVISQASEKVLQDVELLSNQGLVGKSSRRPGGLCTGNVRSYNDVVEYYSERTLVSSLMVSRIVDIETDRVLGLLVVDSQMRDVFFQEHKTLLDRFSLIAAQLISNIKLSQRLKRISWRNERAYQMAVYFAQQSDANEILKGIVGNYPATFDVDRFFMFDQFSGKGRLFFSKGGGEQLKGGMAFDLSAEGIVQDVFHSGKALLADRSLSKGRISSADKNALPIGSLMAGPLLSGDGSVIAVIVVEKESEGFFSPDSLMLFETLNANAGTAFSKAKTLEMLERQAATDGLTGIANHRQFQALLDQSLARRHRDGMSLALLLIDIDHFKLFNDNHGHQLGDAMLRKVADVLRRTVRTGDSAARYGGEEFVVILETAADDEAVVLANRIREAVAALRIPHEGEELRVTISIGVAIYPYDASEKSALIECADQALYASKDAGRNCVTSYRTLPTTTSQEASGQSSSDSSRESSSFLEKND